VEGLTYTWTKREIFSQLQDKDLQNQFEDLFIQPDNDDPNQVFVLRLKTTAHTAKNFSASGSRRNFKATAPTSQSAAAARRG
jgi:hypothetical protein